MMSDRLRRLAHFAVCLSLALAAATAALTAQTEKKHFLWTVKSEGAPPTYLLGSIHVLTSKYYPLPARIEQAFLDSTVLIEEIDLGEAMNPSTAMAMLDKAMFTDGRTLDAVIPAGLYKQVIDRAEKLGIPAAGLQLMKPWVVAITLTVPTLNLEGFNAEYGVDRHFYDRAKKMGMKRRALETVEYQIGRLDQMPLATQEAMLRAAITDLDLQISSFKTIADAWARGDTKTIERLILTSFQDPPELYERLVVERNRNWVEHVEACLQEKTTCFVVVGAGHLVGPKSLVALLQQKGYTVEQQ